MAFTYTTLASTLEDYLQQEDTAFIAAIPGIIRQAEDRILKATNLPVFKTSATPAMVSGNHFLAAPSDMLSPLALSVVDGSGTYIPLIFRDSSLIYEMYGGTATGVPVYYSLYNASTFMLGPKPDSNYATSLQYFYRPASIVDAATSWLGTNAENALLYACLVEAYTYMKGDPQVLKTYQDSFVMALKALQRLGEGLSERDNYTDNAPSIPVEKKA